MNGYEAYIILVEASIGPKKHYDKAKEYEDQSKYWACESKGYQHMLPDTAKLMSRHSNDFARAARRERNIGNAEVAGLGLIAGGTALYALHKAKKKREEKNKDDDE